MRLRVDASDPVALAEFRRRLPGLRLQLAAYQRNRILKLANEVIMDEITRRMEARKIHKKIIQGTAIAGAEHTGPRTVRIRFRSEYFSDEGFDVALAREKGTRRHWVAPVKKKALSWIQAGVRRFSKGHYVSGLPEYRTIRETIEERGPEFVRRYNEEMGRWIISNMGGTVRAG